MSAIMQPATFHMPSSETTLLFTCARTYLEKPNITALETVLQQKLEWGELWHMAAQHGVLPLLYWNLRRHGVELVPEHFIERLETWFHQGAVRNLSAMNMLIQILNRFRRHDIAAIPLNGPVLASSVYGNVALRTFNDLDILVRPSDVPRAAQLLASEGFHETSKKPDHFCFHHWDNHMQLKLHWQFSQEQWLNLDFDQAHLQPVTLAGQSISALAPADLMLYLCLHGSHNSWGQLRWVVDVAETIRALEISDWDSIMAHADCYQARRVVLLGLSLARRLLDAPVPDSVFTSESSVVRRLSNELEHALFTHQPRKLSTASLFIQRIDPTPVFNHQHSVMSWLQSVRQWWIKKLVRR